MDSLDEPIYNSETPHYKEFTLREYACLWIEGFISYFAIFRDVFMSLSFRIFGRRKNQDGASKDNDDYNSTDIGQFTHAESEGTLAPPVFGMRFMAKLCAPSLLWIPTYLFNLQPGAMLTSRFVTTSYSILAVISIITIATTVFIMTPVFMLMMPGLRGRGANFVMTIMVFGETIFVLMGVIPQIALLFQRKFLKRYILQDLNQIRSPKELQTLRATWFRAFGCWMAFLSEPLYGMSAIYHTLRQPTFFPSMDPNKFWYFRWIFLIGSFPFGIWTAFVANLIPTVTASLMCCISDHVHILLEKQLFRSNLAFSRRASRRSYVHVRDELVKLFNSVDLHKELAGDLGIQTLTEDWPEIEEIHWGSTREQQSIRRSERLATRKRPARSAKQPQDELYSRDLSLTKVLFIYKNLIKSFSELQIIIGEYERRFGPFHIAYTCLRGVGLAQWVSTSYLQVKFEKSYGLSLYGIYFALLLFVFECTVTFITFDSLSAQMRLVKRKLFTLNMRLVDQKRDVPIKDYEASLIWSQYDQIERLAVRVNFKFFGATYYDKKVLTKVLTNEISLIVLYVQIVDMISMASPK